MFIDELVFQNVAKIRPKLKTAINGNYKIYLRSISSRGPSKCNLNTVNWRPRIAVCRPEMLQVNIRSISVKAQVGHHSRAAAPGSAATGGAQPSCR